jgi:hypothetical protein
MSDHRSYFSRNNTIVFNSEVNTGRNPVTELFFGSNFPAIGTKSFSRFIFDLDLEPLQQKITEGYLNLSCNTNITHELRMTNSSAFEDLLNETNSDGRRRATSFDLILFRIPKSGGATGTTQSWDEGVGYDFNETSVDNVNSQYYRNIIETDKSYSLRPSNYFNRQLIYDWSTNGIYINDNTGTSGQVNYSALTIVDTQHFEFGDEDISFDMTSEINSILNGSLTDNVGWGIAYVPQVENLTGLSESYFVGFFTRHTQTFYEPYLYSTWNDVIDDSRTNFTEGISNDLYLYISRNGSPINLDSSPTVDILDPNGDEIAGLTGISTCRVSKGIYKVSVPAITGGSLNCLYADRWKNLVLNGVALSNIENEFELKSYSDSLQYNTSLPDTQEYGFTFYGIQYAEKILNTDQRKISVIPKKAYTKSHIVEDIDVQYRIYVKEGQTEVQVTDWTELNRTPQEYFFILDLKDKIPNEYFIDLQLNQNNNVVTYKNEINFQVVNKK